MLINHIIKVTLHWASKEHIRRQQKQGVVDVEQMNEWKMDKLIPKSHFALMEPQLESSRNSSHLW